MFFGINLEEIFYFPFKDADVRKQMLIGTLVSLSAFIIPILPLLVLTGYAVQVARQVLNGESPRMVAWENWSEFFKDGAKVFGVRIVYTLPLFVLLLPLMISSFILPVTSANAGSPESDPFFLVFMAIFAVSMCLFIPISIAAGLLVPVVEMHVVEKGEFSAGFRLREWWAVFRANIGGFIAAFAVYYLASMAIAIVTQILFVTVILACLVPIVLPASTIYVILVMYASIAQAYRDGKAKLAQAATASAA